MRKFFAGFGARGLLVAVLVTGAALSGGALAQVDPNPFDTGALEGIEGTVNTVMALGAAVLVGVTGFGLVSLVMRRIRG